METYIRLCKLLKEWGVESELNITLWINMPYESAHITKYCIEDILRKDTLIRCFGTESIKNGYTEDTYEKMNPGLEWHNFNVKALFAWQYHLNQIILIWHSEGSNPLEQCPKVVEYLINQIGGGE